MSIKSVKTFSYDKIVEIFCDVFDLHERGDSATKINSKLSFDAKQTVYIDSIFERLIEELRLESDSAKTFFDGATIYCEILTQHLMSLPITYGINKSTTYNRYKEFIASPLLAIIIYQLIKIESNNFFYNTLDKTLSSFPSNGTTLTSFIKKELATIVRSRLVAEIDHHPFLELINNIKPKNTPRRDTINQKINILIKQRNNLSDEFLKNYGDIKDAYHCCMSMLRLNIETNLFELLAKHYQEIASNCKKAVDDNFNVSQFNVRQVIDSINMLGNNSQQTLIIDESLDTPNPLCIDVTTLITSHIAPFIDFIHGDLSKAENQSFMFLKDTLWHALGIMIDESVDRLPYIDLQVVLDKYQETDKELNPLILILKACVKIQNNQLKDAIDIFYSDNANANDSDDTPGLDMVSPELLCPAAILCIGCLIKKNENKHLRFEPLIKIILNTQELYSLSSIALDDKSFLRMEYESFIDNHYNSTLLRSVYHYNTIIYRSLCTNQELPQQVIFSALNSLESIIKKLEIYSNRSHLPGFKKLVNKVLTKQNREDNLIPFLKGATLYCCVRELSWLCNYLIPDESLHPAIIRLECNFKFRKAILKSLDSKRFKEESLPV